MTTTTAKDDICGCIFGHKRLSAGIGIQGNKIKKTDPKAVAIGYPDSLRSAVETTWPVDGHAEDVASAWAPTTPHADSCRHFDGLTGETIFVAVIVLPFISPVSCTSWPACDAMVFED
jgi:hypothetical protein